MRGAALRRSVLCAIETEIGKNRNAAKDEFSEAPRAGIESFIRSPCRRSVRRLTARLLSYARLAYGWRLGRPPHLSYVIPRCL